MSKSLWFPFYTADFLSSPDVQDMEAHEVGAYVLLLARSWQSDAPGYLANDEQAIRRAARLNASQWAESRTVILKKWPLVEGNDTLRHNRRLVHEAETAVELREKKAEAGRKSAERRAALATQRQHTGNTNPTPVEIQATGVGQNANQLQPQLQLQSSKEDERLSGRAGKGSASLKDNPAEGTVGGPARAVAAEDSEVFTRVGFREYAKSIGFGTIDMGHYIVQILHEAKKETKPRPTSGKGLTWEGFVKHYLNNDRLHNRLVYPLPAEAQPAGRHAITPTPAIAPVNLQKVAAAQRNEVIF